jgi:hypothetical protein
MVTVSTGPAAPAVPLARPTASYRTDLVTTLLGAWFTVGLFLDAWAHNNVPRLETFFTPWHAVFYSGFVATAAWIGWTARGALRLGRAGLQAVPVGYASALVAVVGFAIAGIGDFLWHTGFGIEQNINILFSPTHVGLITAMLVIVTTPLRAAWADRTLQGAPGLLRLLPAVLSTALATAMVLLFLQYANVLTFHEIRVVAALSTLDEGLTAGLVTSLAVTNLVLVAPILTIARRWVPPLGMVTLFCLALGGLSAAITGFRNIALIMAFVLAGVGVDLLSLLVRPTADRLVRYRTFAALAPLLTWTVFIATAYVAAPELQSPPDAVLGHPEAVVELYTGAPLVQAMLGLLLAVLLVPSRSRPSG